MDGKCVKYKLYGRLKNTVCRETQIVWRADGHKHFHWSSRACPSSISFRPLSWSSSSWSSWSSSSSSLSSSFLFVFSSQFSSKIIFAGGVRVILQPASFDVTVLFCFLLLCLTLWGLRVASHCVAWVCAWPLTICKSGSTFRALCTSWGRVLNPNHSQDCNICRFKKDRALLKIKSFTLAHTDLSFLT